MNSAEIRLPEGGIAPEFRWFLRGEANRLMPISNMLDIMGDETTDPKRAFTCVIFLAHDKWLAVSVLPTDEILPRRQV